MSWRPPRVHPVHLGELDPERRPASWLPLFSDLVFVAVVVQLGTILADDVSPLGFLEFAGLFFPVWWAWVGLTLYTNRIEVDDIPHRALTFVQMGGLVVMGLAAPTAFGDGSLAFTFGFVVARAGLWLQNLRTLRHLSDGESRRGTRDFVVGFGVITVVWLVAALVPVPARFWVWLVAGGIDLVLPFTGGQQWLSAISRADYHHVAERFGEFTLIALGESFLKIVIELAGIPLTPGGLVVGALGFSIIASVWWTYFDDVAGAPLRRTGNRPVTVVQYGHYVLVVGIVGTAVAVEKVAAYGLGGELGGADRVLLASMAALVFVAVGVLDLFTGAPQAAAGRRARASVRFAAGALLLVIAGLAPQLGPVVVAVLVALVCAAPPALDAGARSGLAVPGAGSWSGR